MKREKKSYIGEIFDKKYSTTIVIVTAFCCAMLWWLDNYNKPTEWISSLSKEQVVLGIVVLSAIIITMIAKCIQHSLFKMPYVSNLDRFLTVIAGLNIVVFFLIGIGRGIDIYSYKVIVVGASFMISVCLMFYREKVIYEVNYRPMYNGPVYDLQDIYYGKFANTNNAAIRVLEEDVDYDLINRRWIIEHLYSSILNAKNKNTFTIGIEGAWGSGKTTIINNVKRELSDHKDEIAVADFDPWVYGTQEALATAMYDSIYHSLGFQKSTYALECELRNVLKYVTTSDKAGVSFDFGFIGTKDFFSRSKDITEKLKKTLIAQKKTVVFFIDNIDRADADKVVFLFKLIGTIFNLPNMVYVLAYDKERVSRILEESCDINPLYIEKIIQQEIKIPTVANEQLGEVYRTCIDNILFEYKISKDERERYQCVIDTIVNNVNDIRAFKRLINSAFTVTFSGNSLLDKRDLLGLEVIRFLEPELYEALYKNGKYLVEHNNSAKRKDFEIVMEDSFKLKANEFYKQLHEKYYEYFPLVRELFPNVMYFDDSTIMMAGIRDIYVDVKAGVNKAEYFDLYFSYGKNDYLEINEDVSLFIKEIEGVEDEKTCYDKVYQKLTNLKENMQRAWIEVFSEYVIRVSEKLRYIIAVSIFDALNYINDDKAVTLMSSRERVQKALSQLLFNCSDNEMHDFIEHISGQINQLANIKYLGELMQSIGEDNTVKGMGIWSLYNSMLHKIISLNINLYEDNNYSYKNVDCIIDSMRGMSDDEFEKHRRYLNSLLNEKNIYRILGDAIKVKYDDRYYYSMNSYVFDHCYKDLHEIDNLLNLHPPVTEDEKFVEKVYIQYKCYKDNVTYSDYVIESDEKVLKL